MHLHGIIVPLTKRDSGLTLFALDLVSLALFRGKRRHGIYAGPAVTFRTELSSQMGWALWRRRAGQVSTRHRLPGGIRRCRVVVPVP